MGVFRKVEREAIIERFTRIIEKVKALGLNTKLTESNVRVELANNLADFVVALFSGEKKIEKRKVLVFLKLVVWKIIKKVISGKI